MLTSTSMASKQLGDGSPPLSPDRSAKPGHRLERSYQVHAERKSQGRLRFRRCSFQVQLSARQAGGFAPARLEAGSSMLRGARPGTPGSGAILPGTHSPIRFSFVCCCTTQSRLLHLAFVAQTIGPWPVSRNEESLILYSLDISSIAQTRKTTRSQALRLDWCRIGVGWLQGCTTSAPPACWARCTAVLEYWRTAVAKTTCQGDVPDLHGPRAARAGGPCIATKATPTPPARPRSRSR